MRAELANKIIPLLYFSTVAVLLLGAAADWFFPDKWYWKAFAGIAFAIGFVMCICSCVRIATS